MANDRLTASAARAYGQRFETDALAVVADFLEEYLGSPPVLLGNSVRHIDDRVVELDGEAKLGRHRFILEFKATASSAIIAQAARRLRFIVNRLAPTAIPLLIVPKMGPTGRDECARAGVSWIDLAGNANIRGDDLIIVVEGKKAPSQRGRPSDLFAPRSSRVARVLLVEADRTFKQSELAELTQLGAGFISRIVQSLCSAGYAERNDHGVKLRDRRGLLRDWAESYNFFQHDVTRGHSPLALAEDSLESLSSVLTQAHLQHAATGLAGAWLLAPFATFRIVTFYLRDHLDEKARKRLSFRETDKGANIWFVTPKDQGVFYGEQNVSGVPCAHPIQVYLDLRAHPERSEEARDALEERYFPWLR